MFLYRALVHLRMEAACQVVQTLSLNYSNYSSHLSFILDTVQVLMKNEIVLFLLRHNPWSLSMFKHLTRNQVTLTLE